ncbi:hypothetical protein GP475_02030 [Corynebacterium poyangense]|uniref:Uncharacterized protein n=1 Tax=Corynebacterium poyangense TaxID=2684405 RepID=A0A7H0SLX4_9CORY|nr:LssY C-terminal domain-containing protein [Corynebacterium poyangense]MBZ8177656.1 hypothetical protein [Corynebacterium poyangense]QNQ89549.1 hypothetical protein GP475_02030 [Corynebacterium poyangense]
MSEVGHKPGDRGTERVFDQQIRPTLPGAKTDTLFFVLGGIASLWFTVLLLTSSFTWGWMLLLLVPFWIVTAYLTLPRLHRIFTTIYVPDYFFGRSRTSEGMLGDPVNLAAEGTAAQIHAAMSAAGWTLAEDVTFHTSWKIVIASVFRRSYPTAPVSPLFLFGRKQDLAYQQEVEGNPAQRHHVRFWRCPDDWLLPGGRRVGWLAAGTFDTSVGLSFFTFQVTHRIDANIDVERDHIVASLTETHPDLPVDVIEDFSTGYHHRNGGGDLIHTDGDLPVLCLNEIEAPPANDAVTPYQVVRASRGYHITDGPHAQPDPDAADPADTLVSGATVERPQAIKVALGMLICSLAAQTFALIRAIVAGHPTPVAVTGTADFIVPPQFITPVLWGIAAGIAVLALLTVLTYVGYQAPRVLLMFALSALLFIKLLDGTMPNPGEITIHLLITGVNLIALLTLSSDSVRTWSRRGRPTFKDLAELMTSH